MIEQIPLHCRRSDNRRVPTLAELDTAAWFGDAPGELQRDAWARVAMLLRGTFPHGEIGRTPALTGALCAESVLPWQGDGLPYVYPALPVALQDTLRANMTQARRHVAAPKGARGRDIVLYDRRLAYLAHLETLPTTRYGVQHDEKNEFDRARLGFYRVEASVPGGWKHVGLLPCKGAGVHWDWPERPGAEFTGWYSDRELSLAARHGWEFYIRERVLLDNRDAPGNRPLRKFAELVKGLAGQADKLPPTPVNRLVRLAVRGVAIYTIGYFLRQPRMRAEYPSLDELPADRPPGELEILPSGRVRFEYAAPRNSFRARFCRPEWALYAYAGARCVLTEHALQLPRADILAFDTDSLYLQRDPGIADTGKIGALRHESSWHRERPRQYPSAMVFYQGLHAGREVWNG